MFAGFRSRWTIPLSWATSRASAICRAMTNVDRGTGVPRLSRAALDDVRERVRERFAVDELENQEANAVRFLEAVYRADVGVVQRREHPRLALEAREAIRIAGERLRQDLDRDVARELGVACAVHLAHAARADQRSAGDTPPRDRPVMASGARSVRRCGGIATAGLGEEPSRRTPTRAAAIRRRAAARHRRDMPRRETPRARPVPARAPRDTGPRFVSSVRASSRRSARRSHSRPFPVGRFGRLSSFPALLPLSR